MKFSVEWPRPTSLAQRIEYATICANDLKILPSFGAVVVDDMDDQFNHVFRSWPTAYYVVGADQKLLYIGDADDDASAEGEMYARYDVNELIDFLQRWE